MIFFQIDLDNNSLREDSKFEKTLLQLAVRYPNINEKIIYSCLKIVGDIINHEAETILKQKVPYPSKRFNDDIMGVINNLQNNTYPKETGPFSHYQYLPPFLSSDPQQLAQGLLLLNYSAEDSEALTKQAPEIATLMKYVIELKRQAMDRYIKEEWPLTKQQQRALAVKKANAQWGTFQQAATGQKAITEKKENVRLLEDRDNINSL